MKGVNSKPLSQGLKGSIPFLPWVYFGIFLISNALISYYPMTLPIKLYIGTFGLLLPWLLASWTILEERFHPQPFQPALLNPKNTNFAFEKPPRWFWFLFIFLILVTRFYRLTTLPFWPIADEGTDAILGMGQAKSWQWRLLWGPDQHEPLLIWFLGIYFKILNPSLFSLRLFSTLLSIATSFLAYWAARKYFSAWLSFFFCWFLTFSFWNLTLARLCIVVILIPSIQCLCFGWLGLFLKTTNLKEKWVWLIILSLGGTIGFYAWLNWGFVWLSLGAILTAHCLRNKVNIKKMPIVFISTAILFVLPLGLARFSPGGTQHIQDVFTVYFLKPLCLYLTCVFWDGSFSFPYGSNWGGIFNPILSSLIFVGLLYLFRTGKKIFIISFIFILFFSTLPGVLTKSIELYRILPLFPFLTILASLGIICLFFERASLFTLGGAIILMMGSLGLDLHNYFNHYSNIQTTSLNQQWRNVEYYDAYKILENQTRLTGPIYIFSEFNTDYDNKTLNIACYPFDVLQNPSLSKAAPQWAAVILNSQYFPFLIKNYPGLKFKILNTDKQGSYDPRPFGIFLIPVSQISKENLSRWIKADQVHRQLGLEIKNKTAIESWEKYSEFLSNRKDQVIGDRFLEAFYWEKLAFFNFLARDFKSAAEFYQTAIQQGYPAAHLYYDLGISLKATGNMREGQSALEKAEAQSNKLSINSNTPLESR